MNKKKYGYPREYYVLALDLYGEHTKIPDYNRESSHLKKIFSWLDALDLLSERHIEGLIKAQKWAIENKVDKIWASVPFLPTGLSYNMFNRLIYIINNQHNQGSYYDKLQEVLNDSKRS